MFVPDRALLRLLGVLVEAINTVSTIEREQLEVDFAKKALWELINKGAIAAIQNIMVGIKFYCMTLCHHNSSHMNRLVPILDLYCISPCRYRILYWYSIT